MAVDDEVLVARLDVALDAAALISSLSADLALIFDHRKPPPLNEAVKSRVERLTEVLDDSLGMVDFMMG